MQLIVDVIDMLTRICVCLPPLGNTEIGGLYLGYQ
jgi:hypothetical protein